MTFSLKKAVLTGFILLLAGGIGLAILNAKRRIQTSEDKAQNEASEAGQQKSGVSGKNVSFTVSESGKLAWRFTAASVAYQGSGQTDGVATLTGVHGQYFKPDVSSGEIQQAAKPLATFDAQKGQYDQTRKILTLSDGVRIESLGGSALGHSVSATAAHPVIASEQLVWREKDPYLVASGQVSVTTPGFGKTTASRCRFTMDFSTIRLEGGTRTEITEAGL